MGRTRTIKRCLHCKSEISDVCNDYKRKKFCSSNCGHLFRYYNNHKMREKLQEYQRRYQRKYNRENKDRINEYQRKRYQENKDKIKEYQREYYQKKRRLNVQPICSTSPHP